MKLAIQMERHSEILMEVIPVFEGGEVQHVCNSCAARVQRFVKFGTFSGKLGSTYKFTKEKDLGLIKEEVYVGLGKKEELTPEKIRFAVAKAIKEVKKLNKEKTTIRFIDIDTINTEEVTKAIFEGAVLASYEFNNYKKVAEDSKSINEIRIASVAEEKVADAEKAKDEVIALLEGTLAARDLVNEPANVMTPALLAERARVMGEEAGFQVEIKDKNEIEALGMKAFLEVAKGSVNEPKLIVMRYFGDEENKAEVTGLVGKGLTFDTGGYSLKPNDGMVNKKSDMGGAAAVIGAMNAIAKNKLKANVVAVVAACENVIAGNSYKPGDIIGSMAGKTIEVLNTDAEGRLTLADAVYYAVEKEGVNRIVDLATLTGAALVALGDVTTAVIGNDDSFYQELKAASELAGEKVWQLPAFPEYKEQIKSSIADLKNTGGRFAGTITAGLFIGEFVKETPWLHLDIAGTAWANSDKSYITKGGTGNSVRTLYYLIKNQK